MAKPEIIDTTARCHPDELETASVGRLLGQWVLRTNDSFAEGLVPHYFDGVASHGLRRHDRLECVFGCNGDSPEHALLVVDEITIGGSEFSKGVVVSVLRQPEKAKRAQS